MSKHSKLGRGAMAALAASLLAAGTASAAGLNVDLGAGFGAALDGASGTLSASAGARSTTSAGAATGSLGVGLDASLGATVVTDEITVDRDDAADQAPRADGGAQVTSAAAVSSGADLESFLKATVAADANLEEVSVEEDSVYVTYPVRGRFLGLFPVTVEAEAEVGADGSVDIDYPWYEFLTYVDDDELRADIEARARAVLAANATTDGKFTARGGAIMVAGVRTVMAERSGAGSY